MSLVDESDTEPMTKDMLEDILDGSQYHPIINRIEARYKIRYIINQRRVEWKGELLSMLNMGKGSQQLFKAAVNELLK